MSSFLAVVNYLMLGLIIIAVELLRKRKAPYDALFFLNISYFIYFVLAPIHVLLGGADYMRYTPTYKSVGLGGIYESIWVVASYILIIFGYFLTPKIKNYFRIEKMPHVSWMMIIFSLFVIGFFCFFVYAKAVGGFTGAIREAVYIRMGVTEVTGNYVFVKHLIPVWQSMALLLLALTWNSNHNAQFRLPNIFGLKTVFRFGIILFMFLPGLVLGGRRVLIFPVLLLFFLWGNIYKCLHIKTALCSVVGGLAFLAFWDAISFGMRDFDLSCFIMGRYESLSFMYKGAFKPLADPYMGWVGMYAHAPMGWGFKDLFLLPCYVIPNRLIPNVEVTSVIEITTEMLKGVDLDQTTGTPPGFHGYLYMSGGYLGLIVGSVFWGAVLKIISVLFFPRTQTPVGWLVYLWIVIGWVYLLRHGMMEFVLTERFHWWVALVLICFWGILFSGMQRQRSSRVRCVS